MNDSRRWWGKHIVCLESVYADDIYDSKKHRNDAIVEAEFGKRFGNSAQEIKTEAVQNVSGDMEGHGKNG